MAQNNGLSKKMEENKQMEQGMSSINVGHENEKEKEAVPIVEVVEIKSKWKKCGYALLYSFSSFFVIYVNKIVLTTHSFPAPTFLFVSQSAITILILFGAKLMNFLKMKALTLKLAWKLQPLSIFYLLNAVMGLNAIKFVSLPMLSALRRFVLLGSMITEYYLLDQVKPFSVQLSIYMMIIGTLVAAWNDLTFSLIGYIVVMVNNVATCGNDITVKLKMINDEFGSSELLYYNAIISFIPTFIIFILTGEYQLVLDYARWNDLSFQLHFSASCLLGTICVWSMVQCINHNSVLTTAVVGTVKNILVTYVGMFIGNDYIYTTYNFIGINLSVFGSVLYILTVFCRNQIES